MIIFVFFFPLFFMYVSIGPSRRRYQPDVEQCVHTDQMPPPTTTANRSEFAGTDNITVNRCWCSAVVGHRGGGLSGDGGGVR